MYFILIVHTLLEWETQDQTRITNCEETHLADILQQLQGCHNLFAGKAKEKEVVLHHSLVLLYLL